MEFIEYYRSNLTNHVLRMVRSRTPFQGLRYQPKGRRSSRRPFKSWHGTVTRLWD